MRLNRRVRKDCGIPTNYKSPHFASKLFGSDRFNQVPPVVEFPVFSILRTPQRFLLQNIYFEVLLHPHTLNFYSIIKHDHHLLLIQLPFNKENHIPEITHIYIRNNSLYYNTNSRFHKIVSTLNLTETINQEL